MAIKEGKVTRCMQVMRVVITHATPRRYDGQYSVGVELSGDRQSKVLLVENNGGFELSVEDIIEFLLARWLPEVTKTIEVSLELRHAADAGALPGM